MSLLHLVGVLFLYFLDALLIFIGSTFAEDDDDDNWLQEFNDDTASAAISETKAVDPKAPLRKRKSEIMGVIKGYADELQKKRKVNTTSSSDDESNRKLFSQFREISLVFDISGCRYAEVEAENRRIRLGFFDPVMDAFNTGDFEAMSDFMRKSIRDDCIFRAPYIKTDMRGLIPLLAFFGLLHEAYPDAMVKVLERRIWAAQKASVKANDLSSVTSDSSDSMATRDPLADAVQRVDYVYKLVGTRISSRPLPSVYNKMIEKLRGRTSLTQEEISCAINGMLSGDAVSEGECAYIIETGLSFDSNNMIVEWTYEILAADTP